MLPIGRSRLEGEQAGVEETVDSAADRTILTMFLALLRRTPTAGLWPVSVQALRRMIAAIVSVELSRRKARLPASSYGTRPKEN
jgi:hypothetical protein